MKVKCKNIYNEHIGQYQDKNPWITIGKEYVVLEMEIYLGKDISYRLVGDNCDEAPALYNSGQFEVVSGKLMSNWKIKQLKRDAFIFGPESWQVSGFWERCYDGDPAALEIYKREARIIMEEENALW